MIAGVSDVISIAADKAISGFRLLQC